MDAKNSYPVWDIFVRVGHWVLVIGFFTAYLTEDDLEAIHVWAGYIVAATVVLRVLWGFVGTRHARFADFVFAPAKVVRYFSELIRFRAPRYLGHSPAGGAMAVALLLALAATTFTGMANLAAEEGEGPLAPWFGADATAVEPAQPARLWLASENEYNDEDREEYREKDEGDEIWEELHEFFGNLTLVLVLMHIGGVVLASISHRENLARSMVTGWKRPYTSRDIRPPDWTE